MAEQEYSIIKGDDLADEPGIGSLTLGGWLREVCDQHASREALVFTENGQRIVWTYTQLWDRANEVARALLAMGVAKGNRVGVMMTNRPEFLSSVWGAALAGATPATISTFSTPDELEYMVSLSACNVLLLERNVLKRDFAQVMADVEPDLALAGEELWSSKFPFLRHVACIGESLGKISSWEQFLARGVLTPQSIVDAASAAVAPSDPGAIFFSSGSISRPKGIVNSHRGVALQMWRWRRFYQTGEDARTWSANGFFWSGNFGMAIGTTLTAGGCLVLQKTFDPAEALDIMAREQATMAIAWPHQWPQLEACENWNDVDLSSMKYLSPLAGLAKHPTIDVSWHEPVNAYGNTETFTISSIFESGTPESVSIGSSGRPVPGMIFKIVDPLTGETLPLGGEGEIAVKGPTLMLGYLGVPLDETLDSEGFLRTGDGGHVDEEGRLFWKGRLNDIIKTGGANVSPAEIDSVIRNAPGVKFTQTVGMPHDTLGEIVVGCIVMHEGCSADASDIQSFAKQKLASYKVPRVVMFFAEDDIEITGSAKIKTADLKALVAARLNQ